MLGQNLKEAREAKGLSQAQLADKIKVSQVLVYRFEEGTRVPNLIVGARIAEVLETTCEALVNGTQKKKGE